MCTYAINIIIYFTDFRISLRNEENFNLDLDLSDYSTGVAWALFTLISHMLIYLFIKKFLLFVSLRLK